MGDLANFNEGQKLSLQHAWEWFALHSRQRMQSVYYFIVAAAFLFGAFAHAITTASMTLTMAASFLGGILSYIFWRLDNRVRSLIHAAEEALKPLEAELAKLTDIESLNIVAAMHPPQPGSWTYSKVFRFLYFSTGTVFLLGFLYSIWRLTNSFPNLAPAFYLVLQLFVGLVLAAIGFEIFPTKPKEKYAKSKTIIPDTIKTVLGILFLLSALFVFIHLVFWQLPPA